MELKLFFKLIIFTVAVFPTFVISDNLITDTDGKIYWNDTWQVKPKSGSKIIDEHNGVLRGYVKVKKLNAAERKKAKAAKKKFLQSMEPMSDNFHKSMARIGNNKSKNVLKSVNHGMANMGSNMFKTGPVNMLKPNQIMNQGRDSGARNKKKNQKKGNTNYESDEYSDESSDEYSDENSDEYSDENMNTYSKGKKNDIQKKGKINTNNMDATRVIIGDNSGNINNSNNVYSSNNFISGIGMNNKNRRGIVSHGNVYGQNNGNVKDSFNVIGSFNGDSSNVHKKNPKGIGMNKKNRNDIVPPRDVYGKNSGNINDSFNVIGSFNGDSSKVNKKNPKGIDMDNKNRKGIVPPSDVYGKNNGKVQNNFNGDSSNVNKKNLKGIPKKKPVNRPNGIYGNNNLVNENNTIGNIPSSPISF